MDVKLKAPIDGFVYDEYPNGSITQFHGENPQLYRHVCAGSQCLQGHNGLDIVAPWGTPIKCVVSGKVVVVKNDSGGYGKHVRILGDDGYEYTYGHLSKITCTLGQRMLAGFTIGLMGNTGFVVSGSTPYWRYNPYAGTHLHLQRRKFTKWNGQGNWTISYPTGDKGIIEDYGNGFLGSQPILEEHFENPAEEAAKILEEQARVMEKQNARDSAILRAVAAILRAFGI